MKPVLIVVTGILLMQTANGQTTEKGTVTVIVKNEHDQAFGNVTVELLRSGDSSLVKVSLTETTGEAVFENIGPGSYLLKAGAINYLPYYTDSFVLWVSHLQLPSICLKPQPGELSAITITARRPFIQKLTDRIVVNVEGSSINAGSSAMDVLERSPGVSVDQNDVISLRGRSGVIIFMDGKPTAMSGADLANYLRGLPSAAIDRIEIITNPSAKYDAAGSAGIIDIRMKKDQSLGSNGTLTAGYGQGVYPKANAGVGLNYRNTIMNAFGSYNYAWRVGLNHLVLDRNFYNSGVYNGGDLKDNYARSPFSSNTARAGIDFFPGKKSILGFVVNASFNKYDRESRNHSTVINPQKQPASTFRSLATNDDNGNNIVVNVNFKHSFDSLGKVLTVDADYGSYRSGSLSVNATSYYNLDGSVEQPDYILHGNQAGKLNFKTAKLDYVHPLSKIIKAEAGVKTSFVSSDNDAKFFDWSDGNPRDDVNKTNHFLYKENNNAGYLNLSSEFKKLSIQVGLRGEHTHIKTEQRKGNIRFDSAYFQIFPSAFFQYKLKEDQTVGVSVSRRIDRPGYSQLNPFLFLIDATTYATGQPGLLPQLTWSYELSYSWKNLNFTLGYSRTSNNQNIAIARFSDVFPQIPSSDNVTVQIPVNLSSSDYYGLSVSAPVRISTWWNMVNNADVYYNHFNGSLGNTVLDNGKPAVDIRTNNSFTLSKGWTAELNAGFNSGGQYGFMVSDPQWGLAAGVQKTILKNKGTVRFNVTDIFWTNLPRAVITYDNYVERWHAWRETRVATLSFTYRFGNNKVQAARRRTTASEEERQRAAN